MQKRKWEVRKNASHKKKKSETLIIVSSILNYNILNYKKGRRKIQGVPQSQAAAHPRHEEEEETDKSK